MPEPNERSRFPDPCSASPDGLLCYGGDLEPNTLLDAYSHGIFPWPREGMPILWFSPPVRGVLDFQDVHWPRRFLRELKKDTFEVTFNRAFASVIEGCASAPRRHEAGTWILPEMKTAYIRLHELGYAHSVECWTKSPVGRELAGGLYGVYIAGVFSAESMFYRVSNASKRCLYALIEELKKSGLTWMDIQMVTPISESIGGKYIRREEFLARLEKARANPRKLTFTKQTGSLSWG